MAKWPNDCISDLSSPQTDTHLFEIHQDMVGTELCALNNTAAFQLKEEEQGVTALKLGSLCPLDSPMDGMDCG